MAKKTPHHNAVNDNIELFFKELQRLGVSTEAFANESPSGSLVRDFAAFQVQQSVREERGFHNDDHMGGFTKEETGQETGFAGLTHDLIYYIDNTSPWPGSPDPAKPMTGPFLLDPETNRPKECRLNVLIGLSTCPPQALDFWLQELERVSPDHPQNDNLANLTRAYRQEKSWHPVSDELKCELFTALALTDIGAPKEAIARECLSIYATWHRWGPELTEKGLASAGNVTNNRKGLEQHAGWLENNVFHFRFLDREGAIEQAITTRNHDIHKFLAAPHELQEVGAGKMAKEPGNLVFYRDTIANIDEGFRRVYPSSIPDIEKQPYVPLAHNRARVGSFLDVATPSQIAIAARGNAQFMEGLYHHGQFGTDNPEMEANGRLNARHSSEASHIIIGVAALAHAVAPRKPLHEFTDADILAVVNRIKEIADPSESRIKHSLAMAETRPSTPPLPEDGERPLHPLAIADIASLSTEYKALDVIHTILIAAGGELCAGTKMLDLGLRIATEQTAFIDEAIQNKRFLSPPQVRTVCETILEGHLPPPIGTPSNRQAYTFTSEEARTTKYAKQRESAVEKILQRGTQTTASFAEKIEQEASAITIPER